MAEMLDYWTWRQQNYPSAWTRPSESRLQELYKEYVNNFRRDSIFSDLTSGNISGLDAQGALVSGGISLNPEQTEYLNNIISKDAADRAYQQTLDLRNSQITSSAEQYQKLGLNPGSVLSSSLASGSSIGAAATSKNNVAQERAINEFNQRANTTRTLLSLLGSLASAGISGASMIASREIASKMASSTAHSAYKTLYKRNLDSGVV